LPSPLPLFVYVLALAVFAQGTSEFMLAGLVPGIAAELSVPVAAAAGLTSAYAIGMVVGAPIMAAWSARWPRRRALAGFLAAFVVVHVVGAVTTDFAVLFCSRVVAAVVNAGFLAVAMSVAVGMAAPARATAVLLAGVTLSCVVGVPAGAWLGGVAGWRSAFLAVAALCLPALVFVFRAAPRDAAEFRDVQLRKEVRVLWTARSVLVRAALVNGATFATFAYLAVIATEVAAVPAGLVPLVLAVFGAGAFVGVTMGGRYGLLRVTGIVLVLGWVTFAMISTQAVLFHVLAFCLGALSFGVGSALVGRVMQVAADAPALNGASATVALNVGAFAGPLIAGFATAAFADYRAAAVVSALLAAAALVRVTSS
jgi:MFS transporter, DHA1 family, chloramphenicol resistance protein